MDLKKIEEVINSQLSEDVKRRAIIQILANDKNAIPMIMEILAEERAIKNDLIDDFNLNLSRCHSFIEDLNPKMIDKKENQTLTFGKQVTKEFVLDKISEFYINYKGKVTHCFNRFN